MFSSSATCNWKQSDVMIFISSSHPTEASLFSTWCAAVVFSSDIRPQCDPRASLRPPHVPSPRAAQELMAVVTSETQNTIPHSQRCRVKKFGKYVWTTSRKCPALHVSTFIPPTQCLSYSFKTVTVDELQFHRLL